jgi:hypothetical protein
MSKKETETTPEKSETTLLKVVPDNFPIENYQDGSGNLVVCIKESEYKAQVLANLYETKEKVEESHKILNS